MSGVRIMVVDDEGPTRDFICDGLGALGITDSAFGVSSAEEALAEAQASPPDLIISDIRMAGLNGLDLARYLRQICPETKVILVTGYSTRDIEKTATALGVDALIRKPFGLEALGETVRKALSQGRATNGNGNNPPPAAFEPVLRRLEMLKRDVGAQWIGLIDAENQVRLQSGTADNLDEAVMRITQAGWPARITTTTAQAGPCFVYIEYQPHDVYLTSINSQYSLVFIYDRRWQANRVGAVWLTVKQSMPELARLLAHPANNPTPIILQAAGSAAPTLAAKP